jgi:hypothetical protein
VDIELETGPARRLPRQVIVETRRYAEGIDDGAVGGALGVVDGAADEEGHAVLAAHAEFTRGRGLDADPGLAVEQARAVGQAAGVAGESVFQRECGRIAAAQILIAFEADTAAQDGAIIERPQALAAAAVHVAQVLVDGAIQGDVAAALRQGRGGGGQQQAHGDGRAQ